MVMIGVRRCDMSLGNAANAGGPMKALGARGSPVGTMSGWRGGQTILVTVEGVSFDQAGISPWCGWGRCSKCECAGFDKSVNNPDICSRCGHSYGEHSLF